jgi:hypothetical protein
MAQCLITELSTCSTLLWSIGLISQFLEHSQTVGLLGRVISSSQGLYSNTGQHKHRKTHTHIKHPCPEWDSNPRSRFRASEDRSATVTGEVKYRDNFIFYCYLAIAHFLWFIYFFRHVICRCWLLTHYSLLVRCVGEG